LDPPNLAKSAQVCHKWKAISNNQALWSSLYKNYFLNPKIEAEVKKRFRFMIFKDKPFKKPALNWKDEVTQRYVKKKKLQKAWDHLAIQNYSSQPRKFRALRNRLEEGYELTEEEMQEANASLSPGNFSRQTSLRRLRSDFRIPQSCY
jgi:hypothetical protein